MRQLLSIQESCQEIASQISQNYIRAWWNVPTSKIESLQNSQVHVQIQEKHRIKDDIIFFHLRRATLLCPEKLEWLPAQEKGRNGRVELFQTRCVTNLISILHFREFLDRGPPKKTTLWHSSVKVLTKNITTKKAACKKQKPNPDMVRFNISKVEIKILIFKKII